MRRTFAAFALILSTLTGCSLLVTAGGSDLSELTTKEAVHQRFGSPRAVEEQDGAVCEVYTSRRKFARSKDWMVVPTMLAGCTFGMSEFVYFPLEIGRAGQRVLLGQTLRVTYEASGEVRVINIDDVDRIYPRKSVGEQPAPANGP